MNKKAKKVLSLVIAAALLVCTSVALTVAYLTSTTETVENTFTVGKVKITLDESLVDLYGEKYLVTDAVDADNNKVFDAEELKTGKTETEVAKQADASRVLTNDYKLVPGHTYIKDPEVHVTADSEDSYVFVKVENGIAALESSDADTIAEQMEAKGWFLVEGETDVYFYGTSEDAIKVVEGGENLRVFDQFVIDDNAVLTDADGESVADNVTITAYAIQADGFSTTPIKDIWAELE